MTDLRAFLDVLIRRWLMVVAMLALAVLGAAGATFLIKPTYEATATLALAPSTVSISLSNQLPPYYLMVDSPQHLPTAFTPTYYVAILQGADVIGAVKPAAAFTLSADGTDRALIHISARAGDPKQAMDAANQYVQLGAERIARLIAPSGSDAALAKAKLDAAQLALDNFLSDNKITDYDPAAPPPLSADKRKALTQLSRDRDLADSVYLDFARAYQTDAILADSTLRPTTILATQPTAPVAPKFAQNLLLGAAFGLLIGVIGAFALEWVLQKK